MAEAYPSEPIVEIPLDLDQLATQSDLYRALVEFHGTDAINVLTYPIGSPFSKQCFLAVLHNLGSMEEFSATLSKFPLSDLFKVALYLGSDTLLYYVVFDILSTATAVSILDLAINTLGLGHYITDAVIQFISIITYDSPYTIVHFMQNCKTSLRKRIKNNVKCSKEFMVKFKKPDVCLCCMLPIMGLHTKNISSRLAPMGCCGMMVHLQCQIKLLAKPNLPICPACKTTYSKGVIDDEYRILDNVLTIKNLNNWKIHPLPYRVRSDIWPQLSENHTSRYGPPQSGTQYRVG